MTDSSPATDGSIDDGLTDEQKEYLAGFSVGAGLAASGAIENRAEVEPDRKPRLATAEGPDRLMLEAQDRFTGAGRKLAAEELAKRQRHPLDRWDELARRAADGVFPKSMDIFLTKTFGMFYVSPAQDSYMCRLRLPGGAISSHQMVGVANIADELAGGYAHVTTRGNLQLREIPPSAPPEVISRLIDLGIVIRGSGADNVRNVTASPTAGFDPQEWFDTSTLARQMHHYILNHREMYHLPRKFNISFDGGGIISTLADTNDIGFTVVRVGAHEATQRVAEGTYFRLQLGGITGHRQFASDTGWLVRPAQCIELAGAIVRVFIQHGDRTDRKKARLKYLIDSWGLEKFLEAVKRELDFEPQSWPIEQCLQPPPPVPASHLGFHPQSDQGKFFVGVVIPVGTMTSDDMRNLARLANRFGVGQIRLTCWQNVLIPGIDERDVDAVKQELHSLGFEWRPHSIRAGLVACTGNAGCKFAASDTKRHALRIAEHVEQVLELDQPLNIHLTGCHHSCAQHYIGDIGLIAAKVEVPLLNIANAAAPADSPDTADDGDTTQEVEGYHLFVGGGFGAQQAIGRELLRDVPATELPAVVERILRGYKDRREDGESFVEFSRRHEMDQLRHVFGLAEAPLG